MLKYWVWMTQRKGLGAVKIGALFRHFGTAEAVYLADRADYARVEGIDRNSIASLMEKDLSAAERTLDDCYRQRVNLLTCQDAGYPNRLKNISDPPVLLYYRGQVPAVDEEPIIAMVGSRRCTPYGLLCAKRFGFHVASCGCVVASGGARGIDTMALRGAVSAGKPVICVLGCGVDVVYPKENEALFRDVESNGWLLSEYPPGTPPEGRHFPVRNRIISGLSVGVLVVEAAEKSGALITANLALEQGRDVFAIPGNIGVPSCKGSNKLLKEGAIVAEYGWDVAGEYADRFPDKIHNYTHSRLLSLSEKEAVSAQQILVSNQSEITPMCEAKLAEKKSEPIQQPEYIDPEEILPSLTETEQKIIQMLKNGRLHVDTIIAQSGLGTSTVLAALTMLEVKHFIQRYPGKYFSLAEK